MLVTASLSLIIPVYNERHRLPKALESVISFAASSNLDLELIIVDDGSRDETAAVAECFHDRIPRLRILRYSQNAGKGYAIRRGALEASEAVLLISDADLSTPLEELLHLWPLLETHDIVIGSRALDETKVLVRQPWYRQAMGKLFNRMMRAITGLPFLDTQCGFKLIRREAARRVFGEATVDRFAYDVEILMLACSSGFTIAEVPVRWIDSPDSRVRLLRDSSRMLWDVIRLRARLGRARCPERDPVRSFSSLDEETTFPASPTRRTDSQRQQRKRDRGQQ